MIFEELKISSNSAILDVEKPFRDSLGFQIKAVGSARISAAFVFVQRHLYYWSLALRGPDQQRARCLSRVLFDHADAAEDAEEIAQDVGDGHH